MNASPAPRVTAAADAAIRRVGLFTNPYFTSLRGAMSREAFRLGQEQFFFAVRYFPRPMAALISRMPDPVQRLDILHNIVEEHGDFQSHRFHQNTFIDFLAKIGARNPLDAGVRMCPPVHAFNHVLMSCCLTDPPEMGICTLGIIEYAFATLSTDIAQAMVARGWLGKEEMVHYTLHAELDIRHAGEFFALVERHYDDPHGRSMIDGGLELGAYAFNQLYCALVQAG